MKCFRKILICIISVLIVLPFGLLSANAFDYREVVKDSLASVDFDDDTITVGVDTTQRKTTEYNGYTQHTNPGEQNVNIRATQQTTYNATLPAILIVDGAFRPTSTNDFSYELSVEGNLAGDVQVLLEPDSSFELSTVGKDNITASITQEKTKFTYEDGVRIGTPVKTSGSGTVSNMTAGLWYGSWNYNIRLLPIYNMDDYVWLNDDYAAGVITAISDTGTEKLESYGIMMFPEAGTVEGYEGVKAFNTQDSNLFANVTREDSEIFIPATVERIEDGKLNSNGPFYMAKASKITFEQPSQLKYIGRYAFCYATINEPITIPASVEELGYRSFNCINYKYVANKPEVYLPLYFESGSHLKTIGDDAFSYSRFEGSIEVPDSVETIGTGAFRGCYFSEVKLPDSVKTLGSSVFENCKGRKNAGFNVNVPKYVESWRNAYYGCYDSSIEIPNTIKIIANGAFSSSYLTSVILPEGLEEIDRYAFFNSRLSNVSFPSTLKKIGYEAFYNCQLTKVIIPDTIEEITGDAFSGNKVLTEMTLGKGLTSTNINFAGMPAIKTVNVNGTQSISENTFENCKTLETINISPGLTTIGNMAFANCPKLTKVNFTGTIDEWLAIKMEGSRSDPTCTAKNLMINNKYVTELNFKPNPDDFSYSWAGKYVAWTQLKKVVIKAGTEILPDYIFQNCTGLSSVSLPSSLKEIGSSSFYGCTALKNLSLPQNLEKIGNSAFMSSGLTYVAIPTSIQEIGDNAFSSCSSMTSAKAKIPNNAESCFSSCSSLKTITLEEGTTHIPDYFARYCQKLTTINFPDSLTYIGKSPFYSCSLSSLEWHLSNNVTTIQNGAFEYTSGKVYIDNYPGSIEGYPWNMSNYQTRIIWLREAE